MERVLLELPLFPIMNPTRCFRFPVVFLPVLSAVLAGLVSLTTAQAIEPHATSTMNLPYEKGELLFTEDFNAGLEHWAVELEKGGTVEARGGELAIDVPAGCTVWFKPMLEGAVLIEYEVTAISAGGANDRVSDLNCFWMARDARAPKDIFQQHRSGQFADYNQLKCYYVGYGGNGNTTTRFRRYIGDAVQRPLLPQHDLQGREDLIVANTPQNFRLIACGSLIQMYNNDKRLFELNDPEPYTRGWFAFRTVTNHMTVKKFRVYRLKTKQY